MNWWWKKKPVEEVKDKVVSFSTLADVKLEWTAMSKQAAPTTIVGKCIFCQGEVYMTEDHFELEKIGGQTGWDCVMCCSKCATEKGMKW